MKIAAVGFCCVDVYEGDGRRYATGNGVDCVINLAKRGIGGSVVSVVGTDAYGKEMFSTLHRYGVDTSHLQVREGRTSIYRMALKEDGDRVHLENVLGVMSEFMLDDADVDFIVQHDFVHTDLAGRALHLLPAFRNGGCQIVFDFSIYGTDQKNSELMRQVDYAFFSFPDKNDSVMLHLKRCTDLGAKAATGMLGEYGSITYDGERFYELNAEKVPVVNTVGAGDAYIAGFMFGVMNRASIADCQELGTKTAAEIIQVFAPY